MKKQALWKNGGTHEFKVGFGFNDNEREWQNAPSIGSTSKPIVTMNLRTADGKPGHPVFVRVRPHE